MPSPVSAHCGLHYRYAWYCSQLELEKILLTLLGVKNGAGQHLQENKPEELDAHLRVRDFHETSAQLEKYLHRRLQMLYANMLFYPALMVRDLLSFFENSAAVRDIARGSLANPLSSESL